ncbi:MAG: N-acetylmuramoyl-L-alanine amidase family protein [Nocardioidaceae bacterium]
MARALKRQLVDRGATVRLTRRTNSLDDWGPCINVRGRKGNRVEADAVVSIHGDGAAERARGFFVIRPGFRAGWTGDITRPSKRLSRALKHGLVDAGAVVGDAYGGDGLDTRTDLGTLNWSDRPIVMVELGNMRNSRDARRMRSAEYRRTVYARGLRLGLTRFLHR